MLMLTTQPDLGERKTDKDRERSRERDFTSAIKAQLDNWSVFREAYTQIHTAEVSVPSLNEPDQQKQGSGKQIFRHM